MDKYDGSITTTGTSEAIRLDKSFFRSHPEFCQKARVRAQVIGRGTVLISVMEPELASAHSDEQDDPVVASFLSFLERDMVEHPERIEPLDAAVLDKVAELTRDVRVDDTDEIPDDVSF